MSTNVGECRPIGSKACANAMEGAFKGASRPDLVTNPGAGAMAAGAICRAATAMESTGTRTSECFACQRTQIVCLYIAHAACRDEVDGERIAVDHSALRIEAALQSPNAGFTMHASRLASHYGFPRIVDGPILESDLVRWPMRPADCGPAMPRIARNHGPPSTTPALRGAGKRRRPVRHSPSDRSPGLR